MCGIAGSINKDTAFNLYRSNLDRGFYSSGSIVLDDLGMWVCEKTLGEFKTPSDPACVPGIHTEPTYHLYHSRGPTVETKEFNENDNHPFFYGAWIVAHNGIISNFEKLTKEYFSNENLKDRTDSCIIPRMLELFGIDNGPEKLEGTFAFWAYNIHTKNLYLVRNSCTLYANLFTGDFSSTEFEGSIALEENKLYQINYEPERITQDARIKITGQFKFKSPYFIL
jgi:glucosamine 6-phosphate synthetase-like amidotransferase/phosphosugar isomerase protein